MPEGSRRGPPRGREQTSPDLGSTEVRGLDALGASTFLIT